ncbi:MAG: glycosyltransferase [Pseudomonadota bacterium]
MKILQLNLCRTHGGSSRYHRDLSAGLARRGHSVVVLDSLDWQGRRAEPMEGLAHVRTPRLLATLPLWFAMRRFQPDIIHAHQGRAARLAARAAQARTGTATVATLHGPYKHKSFAAMDGIIRVADHQSSNMDAYEGDARTISNWLIPGDRPALDREQARRAHGLPPDAFVFGYVGRMSEAKGVSDLIKAFSILPASDAHLVMVGGGEGRFMKEVPVDLRDRVHFYGHRPDAQSIMPSFDCIVLPSHTESFGLVLLEALAAGCDVVATATDGARAVLEGEQVELVLPGDINALAAALALAMTQSASVDAARVLARFEREAQLDRIESLYRDLIEQSTPKQTGAPI